MKHRRQSAFTLIEVTLVTSLLALVISFVTASYLLINHRAQWSALSSAAQTASVNRVEQLRAARWMPYGLLPVDELVSANFPDEVVQLNSSQSYPEFATNRVTIVYLAPGVKLVKVDTAWAFMYKSYTNSTSTFCSP